MASNISGGGVDKEESSTKNTILSTSFTISFEDEDNSSAVRHKKLINSSNVFVKRHVRTFSLPFTNDCQVTKKCSDRYHVVKPKMCGEENNKEDAESHPFDVQIEKKSGTAHTNHTDDVINSGNENSSSKDCAVDNDVKSVSDSGESEGGTYTLEENNKQVQLARKSIDQVFGISTSASQDDDLSTDEKLQIKSRLVSEWMEQSLGTSNLMEDASNVQAFDYCTRNKTYVSKIPSPIVKRREFVLENEIPPNSSAKTVFQLRKKEFVNGVELKPYEQPVNSPTNGNIDSDYYLRETENIVTALQNKLRSNVNSKPVLVVKKESEPLEKEATPNKYPNTRFNKAFSLRRERAKKSIPVSNNTAIPVRTKTISTYATESFSRNGSSPVDKKTALKDTSKNKTNFSSSIVTAMWRVTSESKRHDDIKKKTNQPSKQNVCRARCNSSLSAQEIEFQNWKRRKSYDPLKAAAEDRKKKSLLQSTEGTSCPSSNVASRNKIKSSQPNENCRKEEQLILRSASFHGLRSKNSLNRAFCDGKNISRSSSNKFASTAWTSNEDLVSLDVPNDDDKWIVPKPPSTSLQNTPPESISSRLSLLSNAASGSSIAAASPVTDIDLVALINIRELSQEIKNTLFSMRDAIWSNCNQCSGSTTDENNVSGFAIRDTRERSATLQKKPDEIRFDTVSDENNYRRNGMESDSKLNDLPLDHQLTITWDNLQQIRVAVHDLQLFVSNK